MPNGSTEERIAAQFGRGVQYLKNRLGGLRQGTTQEGFNEPAQAAPGEVPKQQAPAERAKVSASNVAAGMPRQNLAVSHTAAQAAPTPVSNQAPLFTSAQGPGYSASVNLSPADRQVRQNMAEIDARIAGGEVPTQAQAAQIAGLRQQAGFLRGGTDRYSGEFPPGHGGVRQSNLDVTFDPSVSPEARAAFMQNPIKPQAQIDRYNANVDTPRGRQFGVRPLNEAQPGFLTKENSPGLGWQQRMKLNEQALTNQQSGINAAMQEETRRMELQPTEKEKVETEAAKMGIATARRAEALFNAYETEVDPTKKDALLQRYKALTGAKNDKTDSGKYVVIDVPSGEVNGLGEPITKKIMANPVTGEIFDPMKQGGARQSDPAQAAAQALTPEQRTKASKLIKQTMTQEEKAEILRKVSAGEL